MSILSQTEIAAYRADGVVVPEFRLPPDRLAHLQSLAARLIADSRGSAHHTRPLIQVRGRDASGLNDFRIGHPPHLRSDSNRQTEPSEHTLRI